MKKKIPALLKMMLGLLALALFLAYVIPIKSNAVTRALLSPLERKFRNKIEFGSSRIWLPGRISLGNMAVVDDTGRLYYCETADIKYNIFGLLSRNKEISFNLNNVRFYRNIGLLNSVTNILAIAKIPDVKFTNIEGTVQLHKAGTYIKRLYAHNASMRINGNGWVNNDGSLDCEIKFSFSRGMVSKVPEAVKTFLLTDESDGWAGISFKGKGNYKRPSLRIISDRVELNILKGLFGDE